MTNKQTKIPIPEILRSLCVILIFFAGSVAAGLLYDHFTKPKEAEAACVAVSMKGMVLGGYFQTSGWGAVTCNPSCSCNQGVARITHQWSTRTCIRWDTTYRTSSSGTCIEWRTDTHTRYLCIT